MRTPVRFAVPAFVATLAGGCLGLPARDNPFDPTVAPVPNLQVLDVTPGSVPAGDDASCSTAVATSGGSAVQVASRGRCLVLDARNTTDPQGTDYDLMEFTFEGPDGAIPTSAPGRAVIPFDRLRAYPVGELITFKVRAEDPSHAIGKGSTSFVLLNGGPTARIDPPRSLPLHGLPWDQAATVYSVAFDGSASTDPDGDPLTWCWLPPGASGCAPTVGPSHPETVPSDVPDGLLMRLRVSDGILDSDEVFATLAIRAPNVWANDNTGVALLDIFRRDVASSAAGPIAILEKRAVPLVIHGESASAASAKSLRIESWPDGGGTPVVIPLPTPESLLRLAADDANDRVWSLAWDTSTPLETRLRSFDLSAGMAVVSSASSVELSLFDGNTQSTFNQTALLVVDETGSAWASALGATVVYEVTPGSQLAVSPASTAGTIAGLAARPGSGEVWAIVRGGASDSLARLGVLPALPAVETGRTGLSVLEWASDDEFWVVDGATYDPPRSNGLLLVDAECLSTLTFDECIDLEFPELAGQSWYDRRQYAVEPGTGALLLYTEDSDEQGGLLYRADPQGRLEVVAISEEKFEVETVDLAGALWSSRSPTLPGKRRGVSGGVLRRVTLGGGDDLRRTSLDWTTGGAWTFTTSPPKLLRVAEDGSILRSIPEVEQGGSRIFVTAIGGATKTLVVAPGVESAWALSTPGSLYHLDLGPETPVVTFVASSSSVATLVLEPLGPAGGAANTAWVISGADGSVRIASPAGFAAAVKSFAGIPGGDIVRGAVSLRGNDLCVAVQTSTALEIWRLGPFGSGAGAPVASFPAFASGGSTFLQAASASWDGTTDTCWAIVQNGAPLEISVLGVQGLGANPPMVATLTDGADGYFFAGSASATASGEIWLNYSRAVSNPAVRTLRFRFDPALGGAPTETLLLDETGVFVADD